MIKESSNWDSFYANTTSNPNQLDNIIDLPDNKINL